MTMRPVLLSSAPVGSSARMIAGSFAIARAIATRCFCPPESSFGWCSMRSPIPTRSKSSSARCVRFFCGTPAYIIGSSTFRSAFVREMRLKFWNTKPIFRLRI